MDALLSNLRRAQRFSKDKAVGRGSASKRPAEDWQLQAASVAAVTTEVLFGASPAWQPGPQPAVGAGEQSTADDKQQQEELEALAILIQEEWVREPLWGVPTSEEPSWRQDDSKAQCLSPQACRQPGSPLHSGTVPADIAVLGLSQPSWQDLASTGHNCCRLAGRNKPDSQQLMLYCMRPCWTAEPLARGADMLTCAPSVAAVQSASI